MACIFCRGKTLPIFITKYCTSKLLSSVRDSLWLCKFHNSSHINLLSPQKKVYCFDISFIIFPHPLVVARLRVFRARVQTRPIPTYFSLRSRPIPQATVLTLNSTGHVVNAWGENMFFMPHMITVDKQNNVWMTDVAMHQACTVFVEIKNFPYFLQKKNKF